MVREAKNPTSSQLKTLPGRAAAIKGQGGFSLGLCHVNRALGEKTQHPRSGASARRVTPERHSPH
jgi:hypothetical protein